jgi:hypothetical protein
MVLRMIDISMYSIHFDPEDGGRMYVWNARNTAHITENESPRKL